MYFWGCDESNCSDGAWYNWGRWVLFGCLVAFAIACVLLVRFYSMRRVAHGAPAPRGTGWMVPPNYYQSQMQHEYPVVAAPPYNPHMTDHDVGYYDDNGNFIQKEAADNDFAPPPGPPPGLAHNHDNGSPTPPPAAAPGGRSSSGPEQAFRFGPDAEHGPPPHPPPGAAVRQ